MMNLNTMETMETSDANLVTESLTGNREAFGQIVARYQTLVCSLAYSGTGSLSQSEDLAQETFVAAWKQLGNLREPHKLRSWLCQIARNLTYGALKQQGREPSHAAESLEEISELRSPEPLPVERAISNEEQEILWRSIEQIPEIYREPLVLFYREHQSIEAVAQNLELTEDAVKQRLSRGRKLLHEQVLAFVEGALERTNPGKFFTLSVLAALSGLTISAKAATIGATAAKGSAGAKTAGMLGLLGAILCFPIAIFGNYTSYRLSLDFAKSDRERECIRNFYRKLVACHAGLFTVYAVLLFCLTPDWDTPLFFYSLFAGLAVVFALANLTLVIWSLTLRRKQNARMVVDGVAVNVPKPLWEYRSKFNLLGLPLIHIRFGSGPAGQSKPVKAWIAATAGGGDYTIGALFAFGRLAIAPVSIGGCAIGLLPLGGTSIGVMALGGFSLGIWSFGGVAIGWQSFGACAIALNAAWGAVAIAHSFALGGMAQALQANNDTASNNMLAGWFFRCAQFIYVYNSLIWLNLIWVLPLWLIKRRVAARIVKRSQTHLNILLAIMLLELFVGTKCSTANAQEATNQTLATGTTNATVNPSEKFDNLVRDDFFDGEMNGDREAFDHAMNLCEETLAKNSRHAQAMVWHGSGLLFLAGQAFQSNDVSTGIDLWQRGLKTMNDAVALEPDNIAVLIPRGASLLPASRYDPDATEAKEMLQTGVADYEKVLLMQKPYFQTLSIHSRGELLFGLADDTCLHEAG